jgi:cholest-4-en-3-one 26-monooxygenase
MFQFLEATVGLPNIDLTDPELYAHRVPDEEFAELRRSAPVWWNAQPTGTDGFTGDRGGFWALTKHADVMEVSKNDKLFSSSENTAIVRFDGTVTREEVEMQQVLMLNTDPPHHTDLRRIVSRGFTPRSISQMRDNLTERARKIVAAALAEGTGDFVTDVACELPLQAIAELIGVPQEDRKKLFNWSNQMLSYDDPEFAGQAALAAMEIMGYSQTMAEDRKACPREDIVSKLVTAMDGESLTEDEFAYFVIILTVAGNETTRNAITHGMLAFMDNPDQWELFKAERPQAMPDEVIRWGTPVTVFQRTAMADTEIRGQQIKQGQRVGLFYRSANFDEEVFDHPERFDVTRNPNPHLGLGGNGAHYCLGASLAKLEIEIIFNAIADAMPDIRQAGDPERLRSGWINGIKRCPVSYR